MSRNHKFDLALAKIRQIHDTKNADYSSGGPYDNFELVAQITTNDINDAFRIQIANKLARAKSLLAQGASPNHESLSDTLLDLATYSVMWYSYDLDEDQSE